MQLFRHLQGNSPSQVTAIVESIRDFTRKGADTQALCRRRAAQCRMGSYGLLGHTRACLPA